MTTKAVTKMENGENGTAALMLKTVTDSGASVEIIDKMAQLYREEREDQRRSEFNNAMTDAQSEMRRIETDMTNPQTHSKYASYAALDKILRPIYTQHGFGLSFDTADGASENAIRVVCHLSHKGGYSHDYHIDMPADGKGPKGGDVMTLTHAIGAATTYGMRYLLKMMFNVAIGEDDTDGNVEIVNKKQLSNLLDLGTELNYLDRLLKYGGVSDMEHFPAKLYDEAMNTLNKRLKKKKAGER